MTPDPSQAGSFRKLIAHLEQQNVTEFSYRYRDPHRAVVLVSFQALDSLPLRSRVPLSCCLLVNL